MAEDRAIKIADIYVHRGKSPRYYSNLVKKKMAQYSRIRLTGLEGAMIVAIDAANELSRDNIAHITDVSTSSVEV